MGTELKSCPFCSGEALLKEQLTYGGGKLYGVSCLTPFCPASTPHWCLDADSAIEMWNARSESEDEHTCSVESSHTEWEVGEYSYLEVELSCGHGFTWDDSIPPDYCPFCGARIEVVE